jgi:hypothetical protein
MLNKTFEILIEFSILHELNLSMQLNKLEVVTHILTYIPLINSRWNAIRVYACEEF